MAAPFPKWVYDLATEIERGIRRDNPAHIELARLLPSAARTIGQMFVDYEELTQAPAADAAVTGADASPFTLPDGYRPTGDAGVVPVMPLHLSPVANPGDVTGTMPVITGMGPANGASA